MKDSFLATPYFEEKERPFKIINTKKIFLKNYTIVKTTTREFYNGKPVKILKHKEYFYKTKV
jgi:hypothetical protein